jgi:hypothetical protein
VGHERSRTPRALAQRKVKREANVFFGNVFVTQDETNKRAVEAIKSIAGQGVAQTSLEKALGVTPFYLSRVRQGKVDADIHLVMTLYMVALDAKQRVQELEELWCGAKMGSRLDQIVDFLKQDTSLKIYEEKDRYHDGPYLIIGHVGEDDRLRIATKRDKEEFWESRTLAAYVHPEWSEMFHTDVIVSRELSMKYVREDWKTALQLARKRREVIREAEKISRENAETNYCPAIHD